MIQKLNITYGIILTLMLCANCYSHAYLDDVTKDKFILLDPSLDIHDEISYFIDDIITSFYKWS